MHRGRSLCFNRSLALLGLLASAPALADEGPSVDLSGIIFGHLGYPLDVDDGRYSEFDLDRVYLTARSKLGEGFSARVTTDMGRTGAPEDTKLRPFLKYAYLELEGSEEVMFRFGASGTAWTGQYDDFWGHRYVAKSLADGTGVLSSSDIGVQAYGRHKDGMVSWQVGVFNGEGHGSPESSWTKTAQACVTADPMSSSDEVKLPISIFISQDILVAKVEQGKRVVAAGMGVDTPMALLWGEYLMQDQGAASAAGYSATVIGKAGDLANLLLRYDRFDPGLGTDGNATTTMIAGLTRDFLEKVSAAVTYERATPEADPDAVSQGVFVRIQAGL